MGVLLQDLRLALRQMRRRPGFTTVVVLTLALGIGANTAIFSVLDAVLLRPLPFNQPEQLLKLWTRFTGIGLPNNQNWVSAPEFIDFQRFNRSFSDLAAIDSGSFNIGVKGSPQRVVGASVSPSLFPMLGVQPLLGRNFRPEEGQEGHDQEVILSYGLWQRAFGGNTGVIGSTIHVDGVPMYVVGVMPSGFAYPDEAEIWGPLAFSPNDLSANSRGNHGLEVLARIKPGVSLAQVRSDMDQVGKTMIDQNRSYPYERYGFGVIMNPLLNETVGDVKIALWVMMAAVALVLLIACANVANLLLVRSSERQQEMGIRMALGASGWRLTRQLLTESVLLALVGCAAGLAATPWMLRGLIAISAASLPRTVNTAVNSRVAALAFVVSMSTGILFGLMPALQAGRAENCDALKGGRSTEGAKSKRVRSALVMGETALSLILLAGAGLLMRSFGQVLKVDPGFRPKDVLTMRLALPNAQYSKPEQMLGFYSDLLDRIQKLPGVRYAGAVSALPLGGVGGSGTITVDAPSVRLEDTEPEADGRVVTPDYFKAMGIALVRGRYFEDRDSNTAPEVAIIDESLAQTYWPNQNPIGKRLHGGGHTSNDPWKTVVGVVRHVRNRTLEARSRVEVYFPQSQSPSGAMALAILTSGNPMNLATTVLKEVSTLDPELPVYRVRTMSEVMGESVARRRLALTLLAVFAGLALVLASVGIYGVTSYVVAQRQQEIGLRMALGAGRGKVLRLIIAQGMGTILSGLVIGLVMALLLTRLIGGLLFAVGPADPWAIGGAALVLMIVAFCAISIPARRVSKMNPMEALRYE